MGLLESEEHGRLLFIKYCSHCHTIEKGDPHLMGPNLFGIINKQAGTIADYEYSEANKKIDIKWTSENMKRFMESPTEFMPGTKMLWPRVESQLEREDLVTFLYKFA